ncbi:MAG: DNA polymerase IV [Lentisphaerales bacterium]|jgi:DNA polymerase-4/DNA polymerase V|nr:MAG: DNA polymerase IV [Lentisphaerales bacterium]
MKDEMPFVLYPFQEAIIHLDADAFFASVEQALNPALKGRPIVTGKERGIIACASYEAKARGVKRGITLADARKLCPGLVVLPSDYETYSLYSRRMFNIIRRYTPVVEESSIDEAFADLGGMRRVFHRSYEQIAQMIRQAVQDELDITVSIGLSVSKSLAKLASKYRKPDCFKAVEGTAIHLFLPEIEVSAICGMGPNSVRLLEKYGVKTAYDFVSRPRDWVSKLLGKPGREIWDELRGMAVYKVEPEEKSSFISISKTKTFSAPSSDREFVYAKLIRNVESGFIKLRRYRLRAKVAGVMLRRKDYGEEGLEAALSRPTSSTQEVLPLVRLMFDRLYRHDAEYRSTMIFLSRLEDDRDDQLELFADNLRIERMAGISRAIDAVNEKYGKHTLSLGTSLFLGRARRTSKDEPPARKQALLDGETARQRLNLPMLMVDV